MVFLCSNARHPISLRYRAPANRTFGAASYTFCSASDSDAALAARLNEQRAKMAEGVAQKSKKVEKSTRNPSS